MLWCVIFSVNFPLYSDSYVSQVLVNFIAVFSHGTTPHRFWKINGILKANELLSPVLISVFLSVG
jgi:hypothetical protein